MFIINKSAILGLGLALSTYFCALGISSNLHAQGRNDRQLSVPGPDSTLRSTNQTARREFQRRAGYESRRSIERRGIMNEVSAQAIAQRIAQNGIESPQVRRFTSERGIPPSWVAQQSNRNADIHASLATRIFTGRPVKLNDAQQERLREIFGDIDWWEADFEEINRRPPETAREEENVKQERLTNNCLLYTSDAADE